MARLISSKHIENVSDLTLAAPIRQGFVDAVDNVTYETRLRLVMEAMFRVRSTAREHARIKPFVESAERIQSLLDFRLAILDGYPKKLMLAVAFDRPFEPYMRLVWDPLGPLLDLFFCNCDGYVPAAENSFPDYLKWVRSVQIGSEFFYAASNRTIVDVEYLARIERLHRDGLVPNRDLAAASEIVPYPWDIAAEAQKGTHPDLINDLGVQAVAAIGRLFDLYPPDNPAEFKYLNRAANQLLQDWNWQKMLPKDLKNKLGEYLPVLESFEKYKPEPGDLVYEPKIVQGGIVKPYDSGKPVKGEAKLTHACLMLMRVRDPALARKFLASLVDQIGTEDAPDPAANGFNINVGFTYGGLERLGVPESALGELPQEFREGMEARAPMLGDVGDAHPRRWRLPRRCRAAIAPARAPVAIPEAPPVDLGEVDFVLTLRIKNDWTGHKLLGNDEHPLAGPIQKLLAGAGAGVELLAVEPMRNATSNASGQDHFGFQDGISQPAVKPADNVPERDRISLGELLIGFTNDRRDPAPARNDYWDHGTFVVIRKLRQETKLLREFLDEAAADIHKRHQPLRHLGKSALRVEIMSKLMGRHPDGSPLIASSGSSRNDFDYAGDGRGTKVPFQSHIRRANPRLGEHGRNVPRIMRRGLSYGPPRDSQEEGERGVIFMAYNASIAEQFEVVQSWLSGGNSSRVGSWQSDPLMGVARPGDDRTFLFRIAGEAVRLRMPQPFVCLEWGVYLFVPSLKALAKLAAAPPETVDTEAMEGAEIIGKILTLPKLNQALAWKTCFEDIVARDPNLGGVAPKVWAAIRARGGAMRVPYGDPATDAGGYVREAVLVAAGELVDQVLRDDVTFSVRGYCPRMERSIGMIYLGLDDGEEYRAQSTPINGALGAVTEQQGFTAAREAGRAVLKRARDAYAKVLPKAEGGVRIDLVNEFIAGVLAGVCMRSFGLPDEGLAEDFEIAIGPWRWTPHAARKPVCPGDFLAPSSFIFYLDPIKAIIRRGTADGQALRAAAKRHFQKLIDTSTPPPEPIAAAIWEAFKSHPDPADMMARTLIGVMMGFLPPADGNLRGTLYEWIRSRDLWRIQHDLLAVDAKKRDSFDAVHAVLGAPLRKAMQKRPAPDALWRTATRPAKLGPVDVMRDDLVYVGVASATAELASEGSSDVWPVFGGERGVAGPEGERAPTHACPAYKFAMGVMTGALCALLEAGRIEEMPAPLIVTVPRQ